MKYNTFSHIYDTEKTYVTADTQAAFNALCENVKPLTGDKNRDYAIKFLNAALVDTLGMGIKIYGNMIFKGTEFMSRRIEHKGENESGYWFVCSGEQAIEAVQKIYSTMPETVSETYAHDIGRLFCETLMQF